MIRRGHLVVVAAVVAACFVKVLAQQPVRDNAPIAAATASISGTVLVDGATRVPARRVRVTLTDVGRSSSGQTTTTDDRGAFTFRGLLAGHFEVKAFKTGYLTASYGASRPGRAGTPIVIKDGESIANIIVTIAHGGVITGVVRDQRGKPAPGISVRALRLGYSGASGARTLGTPSAGSSTTTDDLGQYRAYDLPPGGYLVIATPGPPTGQAGGAGLEDIRLLTAADVQQALQTARGGAANGAIAPLPPALSAVTHVNYAPVFHPGVTDIGAAETITLGLSEEHTGADIAIQLVPTATVSGTISGPPGTNVSLTNVTLKPAGPQAELLAGAGLPDVFARSNPDGSYWFAGVAPGTYAIKASVGGAGRGNVPATPRLSASAEVIVSGQDVNAPLTLEPGVTISGRVVFEGAQPTPDELQTLSIALMAPASGGMLQSNSGGRVTADGRFTLAGISPDTYQFFTNWANASAADKWTIKSSTANGRESFEAPLRVNPNEALDWTITFTDKPTTLSGDLQDRSGRAATDYYILVFPSDRKYWTPGSRRVRTTRPATDGSFSVKGMLPGEYVIAALTDLESGEWNDPALLEQLASAPSPIKVTMRDGETTTQDLRIGGG